MLSTYNLVIDIVSPDIKIDEESFRSAVAPSLSHLDALKGAFDRKPCSVTFYAPDVQNDKNTWSVRAIVLISVGAERGNYLLKLYESISDLIKLEHPNFFVSAEISKMDF